MTATADSDPNSILAVPVFFTKKVRFASTPEPDRGFVGLLPIVIRNFPAVVVGLISTVGK